MDVEGASISGVWFRQIPAGGDVHHRPDPPADGRWQRGAEIDALYFADSEETAWAEWYRFLAEHGIPPERGLPRDLWRWRISLAEVAELTSEAALAGVGLAPPRPTSAEWPRFQRVGEALHRNGWAALLAPSAARPEAGLILCVFREAEKVPGTEPLPPPDRHEEPPLVPRGLTT